MENKLFFQLKSIYRGLSLEGCCYGENNNIIFRANPEISFEFKADFLSELRARYRSLQLPYVWMDKSGVYIICFEFADEFIILGPAAVNPLSFEQTASHRKQFGLKEKSYQIPIVSVVSALNAAVIIFESCVGQMYSDTDILRANSMVDATDDTDVMKYEYSRELEEKSHLSYAIEQKWLSDIENGIFNQRNVEFSPENITLLSQVGEFSEDSFRQVEYMVIAAITLASRTAMKAGVSTYESYNISDLYFQKVSKAKNIAELFSIYLQMAQDYSNRVKKVKDTRTDDYIEMTLDFIARHRTHKIKVEDIARDVGLSVSYLSRRFSEEMGITLQEYILKQRLMAGANMLEFSDLTVGEISEYLSFSSQSYFGDRFKEEYGITPQQYRRIHRIIDSSSK